MKLITHNMLTSKGMKTVKVGYPLKIEAHETKTVEVDYDPEFLKKMLLKLDYDALRTAAQSVGHSEGLPEILPSEVDMNLLKKLHHIILEIEIINGSLECPETHRKFPITNGIPNMLLNEDEV